jgi:MurNAc alpha-1-phosphate uridylyltransferase
MKAMILAAGRGERMRPLTDETPKPLLQVAGKSLIQRNIEALSLAGVADFVVNTAWLAEQLHAALGDGHSLGVNITFSDEGAAALETGGGLRRALPLLGDAPFWLVNGDVLCDYRYTSSELPEGMLAHLILVPNPPHNLQGDFAAENGLVLEDAAALPRYTFAGISVIHPDLIRSAGAASDTFPLAPLLRAAARHGKVSAEIYRGLWMDIGTAERLVQADRLLQGR